METIKELKQAAREREAKRNAEIEREAEQERAKGECSKSDLYALLTAERVFVAQEDIDREVADMNFKRMTAKPVKDDAPEPTTGAQLLAILEKFVTETCDARGE